MQLFKSSIGILAFYLFSFACGDGQQNTNIPVTKPVPSKVAANSKVYDFSKAEEITLKKRLREISGIAYLDGNKLAGVQDESGIVFILDYSSGEIINSIDFAGKGDYEDIAIDEAYFYVLESAGTVFRIPRTGKDPVSKYQLPGKKKREFESLYLDQDKKNLVIICKDCKDPADVKDAYCFNLESLEFTKTSCFTIDFSDRIKEFPGGTMWKPSAAAINPVDNKLYVLCSVGKVVLQCNLEGKVQQVIRLDNNRFRQPEGIAFTSKGEMFIANEAAGEQATLVKINYAK